jgi:F-type H+-transporting ATPase subunit gamma
MASTKEIRRRIKGVKSTGKITRAMEMISAVKMRRAVQGTLALRPYAQSAWHVLGQVAKAVETKEHPWLAERPLKRALVMVITSNRGLCGSFNAQVLRRVKVELENFEQGAEVEFLSLGKKGDQGLRRFGRDISASFPDLVAAPSMEGARAVARMILDGYAASRYDRVVLVYTHYLSALSQKTEAKQLLPLSLEANAEAQVKHADVHGPQAQYAIEPHPEKVLEALIPRLLEIQIYHALLESNASQEAARMMAMRNASDASKEMAESLTLTYNQLRQAKVTQEIAELSAGMAALGD